MALSIAAFTFTSCEDVPEPYNNPYDQIKPSEPDVVIEPSGSGTAADPYNVAAIIEQTASLADGEFFNNSENVYVTGIVTETTDISASYGNATYYISDDAKGTNRFYVYRGKLLDGAAVAADTDLQVGDSVTVCGKIKNYKGTIEFDQGNYLVFYKKGEGGGDTPATPGTAEKPLTVAEALAYTNALAADKQSPVGFVKGKICSIKEVDTGQYGNATYSISDDGTENNALQIYRGYYLNGEKFKSANEIKVGDEVIVTGKLVNYKGNTPQFAQGSSIYKLGNGGGNGGNTDGEIKTVTVAEFIAAAESTDVWYKLTGTIKNLKDGDQYGNFDLEDATGSVYVYGVLSEKGGAKKKFQELVSKYGLANGSTITIIGNRGSYNDKIEVMNAYIYAEGGNNGGNNGGNGGEAVTSLTNGDFETWANGLPTGWKSASSASSATLAQSTDAHGGSYSVNVNGNESKNVRLASQEIELEAGTYTFSFWAKATTADASQARPGYVPVTDGAVGSYAYGDYATLSTSWQKVSYDFTLAAKTTVCLVVMNPKKSSYSSGKDILIDDATLTKK